MLEYAVLRGGIIMIKMIENEDIVIYDVIVNEEIVEPAFAKKISDEFSMQFIDTIDFYFFQVYDHLKTNVNVSNSLKDMNALFHLQEVGRTSIRNFLEDCYTKKDFIRTKKELICAEYNAQKFHGYKVSKAIRNKRKFYLHDITKKK